jgi:hypothetical protein
MCDINLKYEDNILYSDIFENSVKESSVTTAPPVTGFVSIDSYFEKYTRMSGINVSVLIIEECPIVNTYKQKVADVRVAFNVGDNVFSHKLKMNPETWLIFKHLLSQIDPALFCINLN